MGSVRFLEPLYVGKKVKELGKRKWHIAHGSDKLKTVCIMISYREDEMLYYESTGAMFGRFSPDIDADIIGLASDEDEAKKLVGTIVSDCIKRTGGADVKDYYLNL